MEIIETDHFLITQTNEGEIFLTNFSGKKLKVNPTRLDICLLQFFNKIEREGESHESDKVL